MSILEKQALFAIEIYDDGSEDIFCLVCNDSEEISDVIYEHDGYMYCQKCNNKVMWNPKCEEKHN